MVRRLPWFLGGLILLGMGMLFVAIFAPPSNVWTVADLQDPHTRVDGRARKPDTVLIVSFFREGQMGHAAHLSVSRDGGRWSYRYLKNYAYQGGGWPATVPGGPMPAEQRAALDRDLTRLPASSGYGRKANALFVSWETATGTWETRTYDRTSVPPEVQDLCRLIRGAEPKF